MLKYNTGIKEKLNLDIYILSNCLNVDLKTLNNREPIVSQLIVITVMSVWFIGKDKTSTKNNKRNPQIGNIHHIIYYLKM